MHSTLDWEIVKIITIERKRPTMKAGKISVRQKRLFIKQNTWNTVLLLSIVGYFVEKHF